MSRPTLLVALVLSLLCFSTVSAQTGFQFLLTEIDARSAARGESSIADVSGVSGVLRNPAALMSGEERELSLLWLDHIDDLRFLSFVGSISGPLGLRFAGGLQSQSYGDVYGYTSDQQATGDVDTGDNALFLSTAMRRSDVGGGSLDLGLSLRYAWSVLDDTEASALMGDFGVLWNHPSGWSLGSRLANVGNVLSHYDQVDPELPRVLELGLAKRLEHLPFTWSGAWERVHGSGSWFKLGGEFLIAQRWHLGAGYHFGRSEDRVSDFDGDTTRGLSMGVGGRLPYEFQFHWAWTSYGELGALNRFTLSRGF